MSGSKRFFALAQENIPMIFQIDTRNINAGATDGSENPLTFRIPMRTANGANVNTRCIIKVSDGRPDISITSSSDIDTKCLITFATAGIYTITIIGYVQNFGFFYTPPTTGYYGQDRRKIVLISQWGNRTNFETRAFYQCENLIVSASDTLVLPAVPSWFFQQVKEIRSGLNLIDTSKATDMWRILANIQTPLSSTFNPFFKSLASVQEMYPSLTFTTSVNKLEIISDTVEVLSQPWIGCTFQNSGPIEIICQTPNLKTFYRVFYNGDAKTRCHGGKIDVRNVNNTDQWLNGIMPQANVDATLLGWANNLPYMQAGVTWNWNGSKYSNNPAVIAAYNKITSVWGVIFTNLTMA